MAPRAAALIPQPSLIPAAAPLAFSDFQPPAVFSDFPDSPVYCLPAFLDLHPTRLPCRPEKTSCRLAHGRFATQRAGRSTGRAGLQIIGGLPVWTHDMAGICRQHNKPERPAYCGSFWLKSFRGWGRGGGDPFAKGSLTHKVSPNKFVITAQSPQGRASGLAVTAVPPPCHPCFCSPAVPCPAP